jgi:hypothetical protein
MEKNKQNINEGLLSGLLRSLAIWWGSQYFGQLLIDLQSYIDGRDYNITKAIKQILKSLMNDDSFLAQIDDLIAGEGRIDGAVIDKIINLPKFQKEINQFKNDKEVDIDILTSEITKVLIKSMNDQGLQNKIEKSLNSKLR